MTFLLSLKAGKQAGRHWRRLPSGVWGGGTYTLSQEEVHLDTGLSLEVWNQEPLTARTVMVWM